MSEKETKQEDKAERSFVKSVAYEEVVSYRSPFVSYWAVPLLMLFIGGLFTFGWFVSIPEKVTVEKVIFTLEKEKGSYVGSMESFDAFGQIHFESAPTVRMQLADGEVVEIMAAYLEAEQRVAFEMPSGLDPIQEMVGDVEVVVSRERFVTKLLQDLQRNFRSQSEALN